MNVDAFVADRSPTWEQLEALIRDAGKKPERLGPARVRELGLRYREVVADLALARRRYPADPAVRRLERLVTNARHLVYDSEPRRGAGRELLSHGYWRPVLPSARPARGPGAERRRRRRGAGPRGRLGVRRPRLPPARRGAARRGARRGRDDPRRRAVARRRRTRRGLHHARGPGAPDRA